MGRRSINTTKSGKYMNPTDQARKEARKRELKKNKKQRMMVRLAVLKGKDPLKLIEEMDTIDEMEFDATLVPKLSERVLKDKRKKLKETFDRVFRMYEKEDPEYAMELRRQEGEYDKRQTIRRQHYEQVRNAERVQLDQIPLPDAPSALPSMPSQIPLPSDIPLPMMEDGDTPKSILRKTSLYDRSTPGLDPEYYPPIRIKKRKPPGPPPGTPPSLSDSDSDTDQVVHPVPSKRETAAIPPPPDLDDIEMPPPVKQRKIRFQDDDSRDNTEEEKDTRLKYKPVKHAVSALQAKMLRIAGQEIPAGEAKPKDKEENEDDREERRRERDRERDRELDREREERRRRRRSDEDRRRRRRRHSDSSSSSESSADEEHSRKKEKTEEPSAKAPMVPPGVPPGPPPGLPPGPPPGLPPMMFRPPPMRGHPGQPPRMLPPGPPPGRPPGMPPGPPPGLPPNMRMPPRLPPGPPGVPPPRLMRPMGVPPGMPPPGLHTHASHNPNILSAPPSIMKLPHKQGEEERKDTATIEAKPRIKNLIGDVTRFLPTALKVKRELKDAKGRIIKQTAPMEDTTKVKAKPAVPAQTKDDAYDAFMREMEGLL